MVDGLVVKIASIHLGIAFGIGAFISAALLIIDRMTDSATSLTSWMLPGLIAAYPFFGAFDDVILAETVAWAVNAVVYGLPFFILLSLFRMLRRYQARLNVT